MITKEIVLKAVNNLPGKFSIEQLFEQLIFVSKVEKGLEQSKNGQVFTEEKATKRLKKWLK